MAGPLVGAATDAEHLPDAPHEAATGGPPTGTDADDRELLAALADRGLPAEPVVWDDASVDWGRFDLVVIRSTWDYTHRRDDYVAWADRVEEATALYNPAEVVRWNTHKSYLMQLEERGAPVVPTAWLAQGARIDLAELLAGRRWEQAVAKPAVGAGAERLVHIRPDQLELAQHHLDALLRAGDVLVQPLLSAITTAGELSVVVIDDTVTHAVRKHPAEGNIRTQIEHGGRYERVEPPPEPAELATWVVESTGHDLLYARVDLVPDQAGTWQVTELEATEPSLMLGWAPEAAGALAGAIEDRLPGGR